MPPSSEWRSLVPGSATVTWRRAGDVRVLLAAGYALLLQVSHPTVGAGVSEHSRFRTDPWGRLLRTLDYSCTMVYAGPEQAGEMGRRIRAFHKQIRGVRPDGVPYNALEPEAYAWVHATLAAGIVACPRALRPAPLGEPTGSSCGRSGARSDACSGSAIATFRPRGGSSAPTSSRPSSTRSQPTAAVEEVLDALARPAPPELSRAYRPLWSLTVQAAQPRHRPGHRRAAAGEPADTLRHPLEPGPGARAASPRAARCGPPHP